MSSSFIGSVVDRVQNRSTPLPYVTARARQLGPAAAANRGDLTEQLSMAETVSTVFAITQRIYEATGTVGWNLYKTARDGDPTKRRLVGRGKHPAADLLARPNPFYNRQRLIEAGQQHADLAGEMNILIVRDDVTGLPFELWPIRPDRLVVVPDPELFIAGYIYVGPDGQKIPLGREDVVRSVMPHPTDPYRGLSAVPAAMVDLRAHNLAAQWNLNFFHNSAEPGGIIEVDKPLSDDEFRQLSDRWREQHQGVANAHRVAILEHGKWRDRNYTMRDMEFVGLRGMSRETIREGFSFPKPLLGGTDDVNKAAAWAAQTIMARQIVKPRLDRWKALLNEGLLPLYGPLGQGYEYDYDNPIPEDREDDDRERTSKSAAAAQWVAAGYNPHAVLTYLGVPDMPHATDQAPEPIPAPTDPAIDPATDPATPATDPADPADA